MTGAGSSQCSRGTAAGAPGKPHGQQSAHLQGPGANTAILVAVVVSSECVLQSARITMNR